MKSSFCKNDGKMWMFKKSKSTFFISGNLISIKVILKMKKKNKQSEKNKKNSIETSQRVPHTGTNSTRGDLAS